MKTTPGAGLPRLEPPLLLAAASLLAAHLLLGFGFLRSAGPTYDEPVHLASGYSYLRTGRYRLNILDHPPLAEMWAALPLLALRPHLFPQHPDWIAGRPYHYADHFLRRNRAPARRLLSAARRFSFLSWTLPLFAAVLAWAWRVSGPAGLAGAAWAYAFCPALISNLALVTTDGASCALFFLACWLLSGLPPGHEAAGRPARWALAGAYVGLALASKFNMILLPPLCVALLVVGRYADPPGPGLSARSLILLLAAAFAALAAAYRFTQLPLYWEGLWATLHRLEQGRSSFFLGRHSVQGSWAYFPVALAMKTPLPACLLALAGFGALTRRRDGQSLWLVLPPAVYLCAALFSKVQIGYRHALPVVPFLLVWAGCGAALLWRRSWGRPVVLALALWQAVSVLRVQPFQLAYFNEAAGGPERGYLRLTDSNLDWGQDLPTLSKELLALGNPPLYLSYFGTDEPEEHGLRYLPVAPVGSVERAGNDADPSASGRVLLAVSATNLQATYYADKTLFDWLRGRQPLAVPGHSIFLYDLTGDAEACARLAGLLRASGRLAAAKALLLHSAPRP